jgi:predicted  nucleic acid-binding Zn-ribbon protein
VLSHRSSGEAEIHESGERIEEARPGSLFCTGCGFAFSMAALDALPECPNCGGQRFRRASIFDQPTIDTDAVEVADTAGELLTQARAQIEEPGHYLAFESEGTIELFKLAVGWTRIGRSEAAHLRFDDATVSRRHALLVLTDEGELRALDDRSLNGLLVNGEAVESAPLTDGDELEIGRYRLYVLEA